MSSRLGPRRDWEWSGDWDAEVDDDPPRLEEDAPITRLASRVVVEQKSRDEVLAEKKANENKNEAQVRHEKKRLFLQSLLYP